MYEFFFPDIMCVWKKNDYNLHHRKSLVVKKYFKLLLSVTVEFTSKFRKMIHNLRQWISIMKIKKHDERFFIKCIYYYKTHR